MEFVGVFVVRLVMIAFLGAILMVFLGALSAAWPVIPALGYGNSMILLFVVNLLFNLENFLPQFDK